MGMVGIAAGTGAGAARTATGMAANPTTPLNGPRRLGPWLFSLIAISRFADPRAAPCRARVLEEAGWKGGASILGPPQFGFVTPSPALRRGA